LDGHSNGLFKPIFAQYWRPGIKEARQVVGL
jgi:hypothetical protein